MTTSRAQWARQAEDISLQSKRVPEFLTIGEVSNATGLSESTLEDSLTRSANTNPASPRGALCRPAARFFNVPLWSHAQLDEYHRRLALQNGDAQDATLERFTQAEAEQKGLASTPELAELFGLAAQTLRRAQESDGTYPKAVGRLRDTGTPGPPEHLRRLTDMVRWARERGYETNAEPGSALAERLTKLKVSA
ncbi:MAG: hypothetical protein HOY78_02550 [Saccharothrix sp.]|nr:hypothetical protein [Saccharothrix sp.]